MSSFICPPVRDATSAAYHSKGTMEARLGPQISIFQVVLAQNAGHAATSMAAPTAAPLRIAHLLMALVPFVLSLQRGYRPGGLPAVPRHTIGVSGELQLTTDPRSFIVLSQMTMGQL